jgi:hypothetical protein
VALWVLTLNPEDIPRILLSKDMGYHEAMTSGLFITQHWGDTPHSTRDWRAKILTPVLKARMILEE